MNSTFKNSNLGFYLYAFIIGIIAIATIFVFWYMFTGYKIGTYPEDTRLGSVYIGGLRENEVVPKMNDRLDIWYNDESIYFQIEYQGYSYEVNRDLFYYDLELSANNIVDGISNPVYVSFQPSDRTAIESDISNLQFLSDVIENVDMEAIIAYLIDSATLMKSFASVDVEDYLIVDENSYETISSSTIFVPDTMDSTAFMESVLVVYPDGSIPITEKSLFDVVELFSGELDDTEMSILASAVLESIQNTNFFINEVNYVPTIDSSQYVIGNYPLLGRNVTINQVINQGFSFYNPNESEYYFELDIVDGSEVLLSLVGLPFAYDIEIEENIVEIDYITKTTTSPLLMRQGQNGAVVEINRKITDVYGEIISDRVIIFEFYHPLPEILLDDE